MVMYDLSDKINILNKSDPPYSADILRELKLSHRKWISNNHMYGILKYNKEFLEETMDDATSTGLFRSVVIKDNKIVCYAPPKSLQPKVFQEKYSADSCYAEEFIEGTMINLFSSVNLDEGFNGWEIATRSSVGGSNMFFKSFNKDLTFCEMFKQAIQGPSVEEYTRLEGLPKDFCYSFVLQHPQNRIVTPFLSPSLYVVAVYKICKDTHKVEQIPFHNDPEWISRFQSANIKIPEQYEGLTYDDMHRRWASDDTDYKIPGIVIVNRSTGHRTKFRNPTYEYVRRLRGNQPKQQYRYLSLRQQNDEIVKYLEYYPEDKEAFTTYDEEVRTFISKLHRHYLDCKVYRIETLMEVPYEYRTHVYALHNLYYTDLKGKNKCVNRAVIEKYINALPTPRLMYSINYKPEFHNKGDKNRADNNNEVDINEEFVLVS